MGGEGEEGGADAGEEGVVVAAGEVGAAYAVAKANVATYYPVAFGVVEGDAAGGVAGGVGDVEGVGAEVEGLVVVYK